jgi:UDP-N-acetylglucosamine 2-epimerase (non-hydrolysing)
VEAGTAKLVGTQMEDIICETQTLLDHPEVYDGMANIKNPYGDGKSAERIIQILSQIYSTNIQ